MIKTLPLEDYNTTMESFFNASRKPTGSEELRAMGLTAFVLAAHRQALGRFCFLVFERDRYLLNLKLNRRGDFSHSHLF